jgi:hypothetical protein
MAVGIDQRQHVLIAVEKSAAFAASQRDQRRDNNPQCPGEIRQHSSKKRKIHGWFATVRQDYCHGCSRTNAYCEYGVSLAEIAGSSLICAVVERATANLVLSRYPRIVA